MCTLREKISFFVGSRISLLSVRLLSIIANRISSKCWVQSPTRRRMRGIITWGTEHVKYFLASRALNQDKFITCFIKRQCHVGLAPLIRRPLANQSMKTLPSILSIRATLSIPTSINHAYNSPCTFLTHHAVCHDLTVWLYSFVEGFSWYPTII
jgi:hypothetical protein